MAQISVKINGREYPIACDDGQEDNVSRLAVYLDKRSSGIIEQVGSVSEGRLLVMLALLVADELSETYDELDDLRRQIKDVESKARSQAVEELEGIFTDKINYLSECVERVADSLDTD